MGMGKKVLLANTFASVADNMFARETIDLSAPNAWLGLVCYSLQIYYDFAGYSDMAIGLGRMFGFEFLENFNFPYIARSVKEFWRRWHISLSSFFRDYVYIPLGGSHVGLGRTYLNLLLVFFLTGFWHGASWSFVVWGLFHGLFMVLERLGFEKVLAKLWGPVSTLYTLLVVMFAWVLFRADSLQYTLGYWTAMFNFSFNPVQMEFFMSYLQPELLIALIIGVLGAFGFFSYLGAVVEKVLNKEQTWTSILSYGFHLGSALFYGAVLIFSSMYLIAGTYNPFIYYRF